MRTNEDVMLATPKAAEVLGVRPCTLDAWRVRGEGPPFVRVGRSVRYRASDLDRFIAINTITASRGSAKRG